MNGLFAAVGSAGSARTTPVAGIVPRLVNDRLNRAAARAAIVGSSADLTPSTLTNAGWMATVAHAEAGGRAHAVSALVAVPSAQSLTPVGAADVGVVGDRVVQPALEAERPRPRSARSCRPVGVLTGEGDRDGRRPAVSGQLTPVSPASVGPPARW